jgi:L-arabinokinase
VVSFIGLWIDAFPPLNPQSKIKNPKFFMTSIAYYITAHGYGHGVRSTDIIRALNRLYPEIGVHIVTGLPESFLRNRTGSEKISIHARGFDIGMVQLDSIRVDVAATLEKASAFYAARDRLLADETAFLKETGIDLVVADIPSLPLEAAARAGIPRVAVGNFSWDWIYSEFLAADSRWAPIIEMFREQYALTDLLLRLPFHDEMPAFPEKEDIPLVARPGIPCRDRIASLTGSDPGKKWALLSFTTLDLSEEALARLDRTEDCEFLTVLPLNWRRRNIHAVAREQVSFSDALASADVVISKPGFGILSDCAVNNKPLIYADRTNFREYPVLEASIRKYLKHVHIPADDLYRGNLEPSLRAVETAAEPAESLSAGGDEIAARRIRGLIRRSPFIKGNFGVPYVAS